MTNAEIILQDALKNRDDGKLNPWEEDFVSQFKNWDKKKLKSLTSKQYWKLRGISEK